MTPDDTDFTDSDVFATVRDSALWFLGEAPVPGREPQDAEERAGMLAEFEQLPFLLTVRHLLDFVGEGRRITKQGELFAVDRRELEELLDEVDTRWSWHLHGSGQILHLAWRTLLSRRVLFREEGQVRPVLKRLEDQWDSSDPEQQLKGMQSQVETALEAALTSHEFTPWSVGFDDHLMDALLIASGPDGLLLPTLPPDGDLVHCREVVQFMSQMLRHPWIRQVPLDHVTGHPSEHGLRALSHTLYVMGRLNDCGLLTSAPERSDPDSAWEGDGQVVLDYGPSVRDRRYSPMALYRAPVAMRGVIARVRARRSDPSHLTAWA